MSEDIILLSSDDEFETPPPKRMKKNNIGSDVLRQLNKLKEITAAPCNDQKVVKKVHRFEDSRITIIIEADDKSKENENNVVSLIDESFEENTEQKDFNASSDCLIVGSDSEPEVSSLPEPPPPPEPPQEPKPKEEPPIKINGHEPKEEPPKPPLDDFLNRPSTSTASDCHKLLDEFLETCARSIKGSRFESKVVPKFQNLKNNFEKCDSIHGEPNLKKMLQEYIATARISAAEAVVSFQRMYSYFLDHINGDSVEVDEEDLLKLKKLEKTCKVLLKRLKWLENAEINFDDDEDSTYMQIDRYSARLNKVYNKYCQLLKRSPYTGRLLYEKIQFVSSKYNEINRAITKSYKTNRFPSYFDVEKCIKKCVSKNNLGLSEAEIKEESKNCFKKMGNLLQMRRKKELYDIHCGFITLGEDPAVKDESLKTKLQESLQEGDRKMKEVVEKFVRMQENNVSVEMSEDSDDSNYKESESESES